MTILPILIFIISSIHYDNRLKNISMEYEQKSKMLKESTGSIVLEQLNETIQSKETALKAKEALEKSYFDLKLENEELIKQKEILEIELNSVKTELKDKNAKFDILSARYKEIEDGLIKAYDDISRLNARVKELCQKVKESGGNAEKC